LKEAEQRLTPLLKRVTDKTWKAEEMIQPELTPALQLEIEDIEMRDEEMAKKELWSGESLCFRHKNLL
jgi:hypothetical protein